MKEVYRLVVSSDLLIVWRFIEGVSGGLQAGGALPVSAVTSTAEMSLWMLAHRGAVPVC